MNEDVTRGGGTVNPTKYKNDVLTQAWVDSRVLATLMVWLEGLGSNPTTLSEIVRDPLRVLCKHLVDSGDVKMIEDTVIARKLLQKRTGVDLSRGGRGGKNVLHNVVLTTKRGELANKLHEQKNDIDTPLYGGDKPIHKGPEGFDMEKALEIFEGGDE